MLEEKGDLRGCVSVLVTQGRANHWAGEDEQVFVCLGMRIAYSVFVCESVFFCLS